MKLKLFFFLLLSVLISSKLFSQKYTDTSQVDLKKLAMEIAGESIGTYAKVKAVVLWTNKNFSWNYTDYKKRTVRQIIFQAGGNCNEQAQVVRALLNELNIKNRRTHEINIQPEKPERQKDAEERIRIDGSRASVFGLRHNDHVWIEFFDEEQQQWTPADPTLGLIGLEDWVKARIGFAPRVTHAIIPSADMLVPIAVFALNPDGTIAENRSEHYLLTSFNIVYGSKLEKLPAWKNWKPAILFIQQKCFDAIEGKDNLHLYTDKIKEVKGIYEKLKGEYLKTSG